MAQTEGAPAKRGRPRSDRAREAILAAAADLLLEQGPDAVSMDAVAARAGVSKATIYRWWRTKETLALDALYHEWEAVRPRSRSTDSLEGDLIALLRPWLRLLTQRPHGRVFGALLAKVQSDKVFGEQYRARFVEHRRNEAAAVFQRAIDRGEIPADTNLEVALDLLFAPFYLRLLQGHAPLNARFMRDVVEMVVAGVRCGEVGSRS
ncbi:MAG TPA: TetR/AcrR family transcriptional regulator [Thermoleophilaceae bacterium]|jgi:AcrR family transcriptional regulator|nr:TetR/AcrR family transcriptional regulator [Thermoleophilaceae bacterium]